MCSEEKLLTIQNISLLNDIVRLPKNDLISICTDLGLTAEGSLEEMTSSIWQRIKDNNSERLSSLEPYKDKLLCGRKMSIAWYKITSGANLKDSRKMIIENCSFNPFIEEKIPSQDELTTTPTVISAANTENEHEYFLRFMFKIKNIRNFYGNTLTSIPKSKIVTVLVNENKGYIEIRTDSKNVKKVATAFASLVKQTVTLEPVNIAKKFGNNIELISKELNGNIRGALSTPENDTDDSLSIDQAKAIVDILNSLDDFLMENDDIDSFTEKMNSIKDENPELLSETKFIALILSGLGKVDLGASNQTLKESPLYEVLKPYVINREGSIEFLINENGVMSKYIIKVGFTTNSIYFTTSATEQAVKYVRDSII